jgi:WD40 repeat protein
MVGPPAAQGDLGEAPPPAAPLVVPPHTRFEASRAVLVAIDRYRGAVPVLRNAVADARALAAVLRRHQHFKVTTLFDDAATRPALAALFERGLAASVGAADRLLIYFAGHGVAASSPDGAAGHLLPVDAVRDDVGTYLDMNAVYAGLDALPCRHVLVVLDCCFAGTFRWPQTRNVHLRPPVYRQSYDRFVDSPAWQALTSAAADQRALDTFTARGTVQRHSPFAHALLAGLRGAADHNRDGLVTATDLYVYVRDEVETLTQQRFELQSPGIFQMARHERGEFVFAVPDRAIDLPPLTESGNPYRALAAYRAEDRALLFGRADEERALIEAIEARPLTLVVGGAGTGKSSLLAARIVPALAERWVVVGPRRAAEVVTDGFAGAGGGDRDVLVVVDQLEELLTQDLGADAVERFGAALAAARATTRARVHIVAAVRSDFEPLLRARVFGDAWGDARFFLAPMTQDQLRKVIEEPARTRELYFAPLAIVDRLINEVVQMPGALALLSLTLSRLYDRVWRRQNTVGFRREITGADYRAIGGVATAVTDAADGLYAELVAADPAYAHGVRNVMLRMVSHEGGLPARRRIPRRACMPADRAEAARVDHLLARFEAERLLVPADRAADDAWIEPAHDVLVLGWPRLLDWGKELAELEPILRALDSDARAAAADADEGLLWHTDPRLALVLPLLADSTHRLNALERAFVERSEARRRRDADDRDADERRRQRFRTRLTIAAVAAAVGFAAVALYANDAANRAEADAERARKAQAAADDARLIAEARRAQTMLETPGAWLDALPVALAAAAPRVVAGTNPPVLNGALARAVFAAVPVIELPAPLDHETSALAFSGDDRLLVTGNGAGTLAIWDTATGALIESVTKDQPIRSVAVTRTGDAIVAADFDRARIWTPSPLTARCEIRCENNVVSVELSHREDKVLISCDNRTFEVYTVPACARVLSVDSDRATPDLGKPLDDLIPINIGPPASFSPDDAMIAVPTRGGGIALWDIAARAVRMAIPRPADQVRYLAARYARDAPRILATRDDSRISVWEVGARATQLPTRTGRAFSAVIAPDGSSIIVDDGGAIQMHLLDAPPQTILAGNGLAWPAFDGRRLVWLDRVGLVRVWDVMSPAAPFVLRSHTAVIDTVAVDARSRRVATAGRDGVIRIWDLSRIELDHDDQANRIVFSPDQRWVATAGWNGAVTVWDPATGAVIASPPPHAHEVFALRFHPRGLGALSVSTGAVRVFDPQTGAVAVDLVAEDDTWFAAAAISDDGAHVVTAGGNQSPRLWDVATRTPTTLFEDRDIRGVEYVSADRVLLLHRGTAPDIGRVIEWDLATGRVVRELIDPSGGSIETMALSPDRRRIVTMHQRTDGRVVLIWNGTAPPIEATIGPIRANSYDGSIAFSADGARFVTYALDPTAQVLDATTGEQLVAVHAGAVEIQHASLFDGGRSLLTLDKQGTARLWDVATGAQIGAFDGVDQLDISSDGTTLVAVQGRQIRFMPLATSAVFAAGCRLVSGLREVPELTAAQLADVRRRCAAD